MWSNSKKELNSYDSQDSGILSGPLSSDLEYISGTLSCDQELIGTRIPSHKEQQYDTSASCSSTTFDSGLDLTDQLSALNITSATALTSTTVLNTTSSTSTSHLPLPTNNTSTENITKSKIGISPQHLSLLRDICVRVEDGDTALHIAVYRGFVEAVYRITQLLPHQALLDFTNDRSCTPLHIAVRTGNHAIIRHLVVCGSSPVVRDNRGDTPLHIACRRGDTQAVIELTRPVHLSETQNARLFYFPSLRPGLLAADHTNYVGETCIHVAVQGKHVDILNHLTCYGADINAKEGKSGRTALHYAVESKDPKLVSFLVKTCRASLNIETYAGLTPYQLAVTNGATAVVGELVSLGAMEEPPPGGDEDLDYDDISGNFGNVGMNGCAPLDDFRISGVSVNMATPVPVSSSVPFNADRYF